MYWFHTLVFQNAVSSHCQQLQGGPACSDQSYGNLLLRGTGFFMSPVQYYNISSLQFGQSSRNVYFLYLFIGFFILLESPSHPADVELQWLLLLSQTSNVDIKGAGLGNFLQELYLFDHLHYRYTPLTYIFTAALQHAVKSTPPPPPPPQLIQPLRECSRKFTWDSECDILKTFDPWRTRNWTNTSLINVNLERQWGDKGRCWCGCAVNKNLWALQTPPLAWVLCTLSWTCLSCTISYCVLQYSIIHV